MDRFICGHSPSCNVYAPIYPKGEAYTFIKENKDKDPDVYRLWDELSDHNEIWEHECHCE